MKGPATNKVAHKALGVLSRARTIARLALVLAVLLGGALAAGIVQAATALPAAAATNNTYVVTTTSNTGSFGTGVGSCATAGPCSLEQAVNQYNVDPAGVVDTITFSVNGTFSLGAQLSVDNPNAGTFPTLYINGNGPSSTIISVGSYGISVASGNYLNFKGSGVEITGAVGISALSDHGSVVLLNSVVMGNNGGSSDGAGVDVLPGSYLEAEYDTFSNNSTTSGDGGAISGDGCILFANYDTFSNNSTTSGDGGAVFAVCDASANYDTFSANSTSSGDGGAVFNVDNFTAQNDTFSANSTSSGDGGAVFTDSGFPGASFMAQNDTFSDNSTSTGDGGAVFNGGTAQIGSSIFAGNPPGLLDNSPTNCFGTITDENYNVADDTSCGFGGPGEGVTDGRVGLSPLASNGGPTQTELIPSTSVAASIEASGCLSLDQRLYGRPSTNCSGGAFQVNGIPPAPTTPTTPGAPPGSPIDFNAVAVGPIDLSWQPPVSQGTSPVTTYDVYRFTSNTAATLIATVNAPTTTYSDNNVTPGVTYSYYVEATNIYGTSAPSSTVSVTAPAVTTPSSSCSGATGNAAFICALYSDILGRPADTGGLSSWQAAMASGASTTQVAYGIATSSEYRTDFIQADYEAFLGRPADPGGLSTWMSAFNSGATDEQIDAGILGSAEFFTDSGGTNSGFVNAVYEDLLGRPADPGGLAMWNQALSSGVSLTQVAYDIDTSNESRTDTVQFFYQTLLNRPADPGGLSTWVGALDSGATNEQVLAGIAGSPEFYNDATSA